MLVRAKEIRLERGKQNKQVLDIYLVPPLSEIHNLTLILLMWRIG
jgi:hypothetical protein